MSRLAPFLFGPILFTAACGRTGLQKRTTGDAAPTSTGTGGTPSTGGLPLTGGLASSGGLSGSGGLTASGGLTGTGGTTQVRTDAGTSPCTANSDCPSLQVCNINTDGNCGPAAYTQVDVADTNTCAVVSDGTLRCWGGNAQGQLGPKTTGSHLVPFQIPDQQKVRSVATGWGSTCVLLWTGQVNCWGYNVNGQLGCLNPVTSNNGPQCTPFAPGSQVSGIVAGAERACARLTDGTVQCWGRNDHYDLGNGTNVNSFSPVVASGVVDAAAIATGLWQACAVIANGTAKCWGANDRAQLGNGTTAANSVATLVYGEDGITDSVVAASPAEDHSCVLLADGSVQCFGENQYGQLGDGKTVASNVPVASQFPKPAIGIVAGAKFTCAIVGGGLVQCLGYGASGQLGNGAFAQSSTPVPVDLPEAVSVKSLAARYTHACALSVEGRLWCWGANSAGQLGNGATANSNVPVEVAAPSAH